MSLTSDNIMAVKKALADERAKVVASSPSGPTTTDTLALIDKLTNDLDIALGDPPTNWNAWLLGLGSQFKDLAGKINTLLGTPLGACKYNGDCIGTTQDVCDSITGSTFVKGGSCGPVSPTS
jgi:hypothetical protein